MRQASAGFDDLNPESGSSRGEKKKVKIEKEFSENVSLVGEKILMTSKGDFSLNWVIDMFNQVGDVLIMRENDKDLFYSKYSVN
jgi:hypothetical protein